MGVWDSGLYDSDSSRDYVGGIIDRYVYDIKHVIKRDCTLLDPRMPHSELILCNIDILNAICSRSDLYMMLPESKEIKKWRDKYLEVWTYVIEVTNAKEDYKTERLQVIKKCFNQLIKLAKLRDKELEE